VAPIDASSGNQRRHRLDRHGNRQLNSALHKIAIVQGRWDPRARQYLDRRRAEGKTRREALRALKRHLARIVFNLLRGQQPADRTDRVMKVRGGKVRAPHGRDDGRDSRPQVTRNARRRTAPGT
jgi:transposase IS116/IS110/IS902 family protein